jgi:hydroxymethylpyrimidine/phosphomethylpyrimidine kinase
MTRVLTIAGYDPSHGAGITKDLEVFSALGLFGLSVPTSFVIQGPHGVSHVRPVGMDTFSDMLDRTGEDFAIDGVKVGVLTDAGYVEKTAAFLTGRTACPVVLDPVVSAKNGTGLITGDGLQVLVAHLLPLVTCVTPNIDEAGVLTGAEIRTIGDMEKAARLIRGTGARYVIIKGGHLAGEPVDLLDDGRTVTTYAKKRIDRVVHGTGCMFSSLLASFLALGYPIREAFLETEQVMEMMIRESVPSRNNGYFYAYPCAVMSRDAEKLRVLDAMRDTGKRLEELNPVELVPAVQMNIGYALRTAGGTEDVAAFPGRIGQSRGRVSIKGPAEFGASSHVARTCLAYMRRYPFMRACAVVRYDETAIEAARRKGLSVVFVDRRHEPAAVRSEEGAGIDFMMETALKDADEPPDIIYDHGDTGKEPVIRLFGRDPGELIKKMEMIRPWTTN